MDLGMAGERGDSAVSLIPSPSHSAADLRIWAEREATDAQFAKVIDWRRIESASLREIASFRAGGDAYAAISWGKDSTVLAHLVARHNEAAGDDVPLVWVRVEPIANPDCTKVRDAFLAQFPAIRYHAIKILCDRDAEGWHATGSLERGFSLAAESFGERYLSGVRASESTARFLRVASGLAKVRTSAPIGWWKPQEIFSYLYRHGLPVHPVYAMSMGGTLDRGRLRVSSLGGQRGRGHGRADWERRYYPDVFREAEGRNP